MVSFEKLKEVCKYHFSNNCCYDVAENESDLVSFCREENCPVVASFWEEADKDE